MQQRVAFARALCAEPAVLLMDEPFASLDAQTRELMQGEVMALSRTTGEGARRTVVFVTHSVDEALLLGDRILLMSPRPGRIAAEIPVPFARQSADPRALPDFISLRERLWGAARDGAQRSALGFLRSGAKPRGRQPSGRLMNAFLPILRGIHGVWLREIMRATRDKGQLLGRQPPADLAFDPRCRA
ncbi:hypothetical protein QWZ10_00495 [Paracoccus cavernae]|uniref:ABC transporter ATP-binding protein n=1 Tax=Paracoccus cavernae TaxID=1571207 RepID=A0ABT8D2B4_9RHOB|nr:hypothetical protein [Paracoccus cavernae]